MMLSLRSGGRVLQALALLAGLGLAACEEIPPQQRPMFEKRPSEWTVQDRAFALGRWMDLCNMYRQGRNLAGPFMIADFIAVEDQLMKRGLSISDILLIRSRDQSFGTGQTFLGLECSLGYTPPVNQSFYAGVGHRWQAVVGEAPYSTYVYLEGNGTPEGMRVTGWN